MADQEKIINLIEESIEMKEKLKDSTEIIGDIVDAIVNAYKNNKKVILFGNGGSAGDAQHIAGEFVGRFFKERRALPAIALHTNSSVVTALSNDYGYNIVFKRQLEAILQQGDIVIGISTSGNSENVIRALEYSKENGGINIGFVGLKQCKMDDLCEVILHVPSESTPRIQEGHITAAHIICYLVEEELFG